MAHLVPMPYGSPQVTKARREGEQEDLKECIDGPCLERTYVTFVHIPMASIKSSYKGGWEMWRSRGLRGDP